MRLLHSLKSSHWVVWSSPILLIVLVLTLEVPSSSSTHLIASHVVTTSRRRLARQVRPAMTRALSRRAPPTTRVTKARRTARSPSITTTTEALATSTTLSTVRANTSSNKTASSDSPVASAPAESVASGELSGQLNASFAVADVPLQGPGTWSLVTSSPNRASLQCASVATSVQSQIVIGAAQTCQLIITSVTPSTTMTWQITPSL